MTDPATINLDVLIERLKNWKRWEKVGFTRELVNKTTIATIEALRERVAKAEEQHIQDMKDALENAMDTKRAWDLKATAEARVAEVDGVLGDIVKGNHRCRTPTQLMAWTQDLARAALVRTPVQEEKPNG